LIQWQFYPKWSDSPTSIKKVVEAFQRIGSEIDSTSSKKDSNAVLAVVRPHLKELGYIVETGKRRREIIAVPVLFGMNGKPEKSFQADAYSQDERVVVEIEAGRAIDNNQFLKDLFQACMMSGVDYLVLAVRNTYRGKGDFDAVNTFFDTLYASERLKLPLKGVMLVGY
jgi:hypothetical protein